MINEIIKLANKLECKGEILEWYVFGSFLHSPKKAKDLDILVIYENISSAKEARKSLGDILLRHPIDLIFMTREEEKQFDFIRTQYAKKIATFNEA